MSFLNARRLDEHASIDSPAHRLDPRAKLLCALAFIGAVVSFPKYEISALAPFAAYPVGLAILGYVPARLFLRLLVPTLPFIVLVGAANPFLDREPALIIAGVTVSAGWISFGAILARGLLCVAMAIALIATTPFPLLAEALSALGAPRLFASQLLILYRYLFLLGAEAGRMRRARALRAVERTGVREAAAMVSSLFTRSLTRAEAVWRAMLARGFDGELALDRAMKWRGVDTVFLAASVGGCVGLRLFDLPRLLGSVGGWS